MSLAKSHVELFEFLLGHLFVEKRCWAKLPPAKTHAECCLAPLTARFPLSAGHVGQLAGCIECTVLHAGPIKKSLAKYVYCQVSNSDLKENVSLSVSRIIFVKIRA